MRVALIAVAVLLLAGCYPTGVQPNSLDESRLETLSAESLLSGGTAHPAEANRTSANANAKRAFVVAERAWERDGTWSATQQLVDDLRADDWVIVLQNCKASSTGFHSAELVALKDLDKFTAGMVVKLDSDGASLEAYAPFHEEDDNPWGPLDEQQGGCLDSADEPTNDTTTNTRTTVGLFYLRSDE